MVFQNQTMYAGTSFRGAKTCKIGKRDVFFVIWQILEKDIMDKLRKHMQNVYLGSFFIPEKYVFRVHFESPFMRMISSLKYKWPPGYFAFQEIEITYCGISLMSLLWDLSEVEKSSKITKNVISDRVLRTPKQRAVRQILKVCKEHTGLSTVNTHSQNSVRNNNVFIRCKSFSFGLQGEML